MGVVGGSQSLGRNSQERGLSVVDIVDRHIVVVEIKLRSLLLQHALSICFLLVILIDEAGLLEGLLFLVEGPGGEGEVGGVIGGEMVVVGGVDSNDVVSDVGLPLVFLTQEHLPRQLLPKLKVD